MKGTSCLLSINESKPYLQYFSQSTSFTCQKKKKIIPKDSFPRPFEWDKNEIKLDAADKDEIYFPYLCREGVDNANSRADAPSKNQSADVAKIPGKVFRQNQQVILVNHVGI